MRRSQVLARPLGGEHLGAPEAFQNKNQKT
jgi:hypothetical protein